VALLHEDIDGSHHLGRIALIDQDPTSPTFGQVFYLLDSSDYIAYLEPQGQGRPPHVRLEPICNSKVFEDRHFFDDLRKILESYNNADPQTLPNPGSGDNPSDLFQQQLFQDDGGKPLFNFGKLNGSGNSYDPPSSSPLIPVMGGLLLNTNTTTSNGQTPLPSTVFIWNGTGAWPTSLGNWNNGSAPNSPIDSVIIQTGTATFNLPNTTVSFLTVDPGATLDIIGGQLNTGGLADNGTINVDGDPPVLIITGPAIIGSGGTLTAQFGSVIFTNGSLLNAGKLTAGPGGYGADQRKRHQQWNNPGYRRWGGDDRKWHDRQFNERWSGLHHRWRSVSRRSVKTCARECLDSAGHRACRDGRRDRHRQWHQ
jgi:hypothetical protein